MILPNENLSKAYVTKAKEAAEVMRTLEEKSPSWAMSACYYSMYYSLYAIDESDVKVLERAFEARIDHQYYVRKIPKAEKLDELFESAILFYEKSQDSLSKIDEKFINSVRKKIHSLK
ncbi:MAG: hypothetical protein ACW99Q_29640 [Candidatus Kariarchaeaceae archaeon]